MTEPNWRSIFPGTAFRWQMSLRPGNLAAFFAPSVQAAAVLAERRHWLTESPARYTAALPEAGPAVREAADALCGALGIAGLQTAGPPDEILRAVGAAAEPDWVLLLPENGAHRLVAGCLCFPSHWDLREKLGRPVVEIHEPVHGLNDALATRIETFLSRVVPGADWQRENWGLSPNGALNRHPALHPPALTAASDGHSTWLRLESQLFSRLPHSGALLFGIRVRLFPLHELLADPVVADGFRTALESMPEPMAAYKGIAAARHSLLRLTTDAQADGAEDLSRRAQKVSRDPRSFPR